LGKTTVCSSRRRPWRLGLFVEPTALARLLVDAGAVALEGAHEGFAADVADEAVDLAGLRGGERVPRPPFAGEAHELKTKLGGLLLVEFGDLGVEAEGHFWDAVQ